MNPMKPTTDSATLQAFVDSQLDLERQLELEAELARDAQLAAEAEGLRALRDAVRSGAESHAAPPALRARIEALGREPGAAPAPAPRKAPPSRAARLLSWLDWRPMALSGAFTALFALAIGTALWPDAHDERMREVLASHVRSTLGTRLVDVPSSDQHTVKPWLSARLDFSPQVHDLAGTVSGFVGGRIDYFDGHPAAALVYRERDHVINAFVWPERGAERPLGVDTLRGFNLVHWAKGGMAHCLVSDLNRDELVAIARKIEVADAGR
jgi:anti-sigma factor RsiW